MFTPNVTPNPAPMPTAADNPHVELMKATIGDFHRPAGSLSQFGIHHEVNFDQSQCVTLTADAANTTKFHAGVNLQSLPQLQGSDVSANNALVQLILVRLVDQINEIKQIAQWSGLPSPTIIVDKIDLSHTNVGGGCLMNENLLAWRGAGDGVTAKLKLILRSLKEVNLSHTKSDNVLNDLGSLPSLETMHLDGCQGLSDVHKGATKNATLKQLFITNTNLQDTAKTLSTLKQHVCVNLTTQPPAAAPPANTDALANTIAQSILSLTASSTFNRSINSPYGKK